MAGIIVDGQVFRDALSFYGQRDQLRESKRQFNKNLEESQRQFNLMADQNRAQLREQQYQFDVSSRQFDERTKQMWAQLEEQKKVNNSVIGLNDANAEKIRQEMKDKLRQQNREEAGRIQSLMLSPQNHGLAREAMLGLASRTGVELDPNSDLDTMYKQLTRGLEGFYSGYSDAQNLAAAAAESGGHIPRGQSHKAALEAAQVETNILVSALQKEINTKYGGDVTRAINDPAFTEKMRDGIEANPVLLANLGGRENVAFDTPAQLLELGEGAGAYGIAVKNKDGKWAPITRHGTKSAENPTDPALAVTRSDMWNFLLASSTETGGGVELIGPAIEARAAATADVGATVSPEEVERRAQEMYSLSRMAQTDADRLQDIARGNPATEFEQEQADQDADVLRDSKRNADKLALQQAALEQSAAFEAEQAEIVKSKPESRTQANNQLRASKVEGGLTNNTDALGGIVNDLSANLLGDRETTFWQDIKDWWGPDSDPRAAYERGNNLTQKEKQGLSKEEVMVASIRKDIETTLLNPVKAEQMAELLGIQGPDYIRKTFAYWSPEDQYRAATALIISRQYERKHGTMSRDAVERAINGEQPVITREDETRLDTRVGPIEAILMQLGVLSDPPPQTEKPVKP